MAHKWTKASRAKFSRSQKARMEKTETPGAAEAPAYLNFEGARPDHPTTRPSLW
jgi:hypothetical protein